ncbi:MAG TPA: 1,2-phenylacetyl-CoA epoxidase subunit B [Acidimicrobiales bacterium]|nr:1,2-phenylacetyl-CoA epoxidase subunit B [Acidimicrobiales bacterium]|tara:strand:- start:2877 stop:3158 length:282 start_codon:yes stop_codon:yes gene_type:complete
MRIYEVFLKTDGKEEFRHAGSIEAATDELALILARENYARRAEGIHMWVVDRKNICISDEGFIDPNLNKPHRHNDGKKVAKWRKSQRDKKNDG